MNETNQRTLIKLDFFVFKGVWETFY